MASLRRTISKAHARPRGVGGGGAAAAAAVAMAVESLPAIPDQPGGQAGPAHWAAPCAQSLQTWATSDTMKTQFEKRFEELKQRSAV